MKYIDVAKTPFKGSVKNVEIEQLSCVKNFLTITNIKQTILFKNSNNQNRFLKQVQFLEGIRQREKRLHELTQINFLKNQKRKMENWSPKTKKSQKEITFPELTITQFPSSRQSPKKILPSVCTLSGKHLFPENQAKKLTTTQNASCFETFLTQANSCPDSDWIIRKSREKYSSSQVDLLSKKSVNDQRFCELESILQTYSGNINQVGQCSSSVPSIVHFYKQKTGFILCSSK